MFPQNVLVQAENGGGGNRTRVVSLQEPLVCAVPGVDRWLEILDGERANLLADNGPFSRVSNIYAIGVPTRYVKIGIADKPRQRLRELQTGNPDELTLLGHLRGPIGWESFIHDVLAGARLRGEWFAWTEQVEALLEAFSRGALGVSVPRGQSLSERSPI